MEFGIEFWFKTKIKISQSLFQTIQFNFYLILSWILFFQKGITGMALDCYLILQNPFFTILKKNNQSSIRPENFNIFRSASALGSIQQPRGLTK